MSILGWSSFKLAPKPFFSELSRLRSCNYSRITRDMSCPRPGIRYFSKEFWLVFDVGDVETTICGLGVPRTSVRMELGNMHILKIKCILSHTDTFKAVSDLQEFY